MLICSLVVQCDATMNVVQPFLASIQQTNWAKKFNDFETASYYIDSSLSENTKHAYKSVNG